MGGFEGGDEAGFWEVDTQLKYVGQHKSVIEKKPPIQKIDGIYSISLDDTISLIPCKCDSFTITGCDSNEVESHIVFKVYKAIIDFTDDTDVVDFFRTHQTEIIKKTSSDPASNVAHAVAFLFLVKEACNLVLTTEELMHIGKAVDKEIPLQLENFF